MELNLNIIGWSLIFLALVHIIFPKYFDWGKELSQLSLVNKQMMYVHTFFIGLMVMLMGIFCLWCIDEIIYTTLGHKVSLGLSIFWGIRLIFQIFVYSSSLWRGKRKETMIHIFFILLLSYYTLVFLFIYLD